MTLSRLYKSLKIGKSRTPHHCITTRSGNQSQAITTEKCTETPSRPLQFRCTFHSPRCSSRIQCQTPTPTFDKKGIRQIAHQPQRVLPSEKYKLGNRLEIPARTARLGASHSDITERAGERLEGTWEVIA